MRKTTGNKFLLKAAILTMSMVQLGTNGVAPILAQIAAAFPEVSDTTVQFLMTFPSIFCMIFVLVSAFMAEKLPKKTLAIAGLAIVSCGGVLAVFFHSDISILFVWAAVIGIGLGMVAPVPPAIINEEFVEKEMETMLGWQNSASSIGSMIMTFAGGFLAVLGWHYGYLVYLLSLVGMAFAIFGLPSPKKIKNEKREALRERPAFRLVVWKEMIVACFFLALYSAIPVNMAMLVSERGIGDSELSGTLSALFLLAGMLMGLVFGLLTSLLHRFTSVIGILLICMGTFLMGISGNIVLIIAGCMISGASMSLVMPVCMGAASRLRGYESINTAIVMASSYIGVFITPFITSITTKLTGNTLTHYRFLVISGLGIILAVIALLLKIGKREPMFQN